MARCAYPNGRCTHPVAGQSRYCEFHTCRCGNAKHYQRRSCGKCGSGEEKLCRHHACQYPALPGRDMCSFHTCGYCGRPKSSNLVTCPDCVHRANRKCRYVNSQGQQCLEYPQANSQYCQMHRGGGGGGGSGGGGGGGGGPAKPPPPTLGGGGGPVKPPPPTLGGGAAAGQCACGGELPPGAAQCANCQMQRNPQNRLMYISEVQNAVPVQSTTWLFVWDFDCTITRSHVSNRQPPIPDDYIRNDFADLEFFHKVVKHLHGLGHFVKIATWADGFSARAIIAQYLAVCFGPNDQRAVLRDEGIEAFIPSAHGMTNEGKNIHLRNLLGQINANSLKVLTANVVLFDDNELNVNMARQAGHMGVHCPWGFTRDVWAAFMNSFGHRRPEFFARDLVPDGPAPNPPSPLRPAPGAAPPYFSPDANARAPGNGNSPLQGTRSGTHSHSHSRSPSAGARRAAPASPTFPPQLQPDVPNLVFNPVTGAWEGPSSADLSPHVPKRVARPLT